jgi:hypothetical protein
MTPCGSPAFATTVRMVNWIHYNAANRRSNATPAHCTGLTDGTKTVLRVTDLPNGSSAIDMNLANLAGTQAQLRITTLASQKLHRSARRARNLSALSRLHLDTVNHGADRNISQRQSITRLDWGIRTTDNLRPYRNPLGSDNVTTLTIDVAEQGKMRAPIRIVLDALNLGRDTILIAAKINDTIMLLMTTTLMTHRDMAVMITPGILRLTFKQSGMRLAFMQPRGNDLDYRATPSGSGLDFDNCHNDSPTPQPRN